MMKKIAFWGGIILIACAAAGLIVLSLDIKLRKPASILSNLGRLLPGQQESPEIYLSLSSTTLKVGESFSVSLILDPHSKPINTLGVRLIYPENILFLARKNSSSSPFSMHLDNLAVSTSTSVIIQAEPTPGISYLSTVGVFTFKAIAPGEALVSISPRSKMLVNDGVGTNAFRTTQGTTTVTVVEF